MLRRDVELRSLPLVKLRNFQQTHRHLNRLRERLGSQARTEKKEKT
jgi:hypothetical protein